MGTWLSIAPNLLKSGAWSDDALPPFPGEGEQGSNDGGAAAGDALGESTAPEYA